VKTISLLFLFNEIKYHGRFLVKGTGGHIGADLGDSSHDTRGRF